MKIDRRSPVVLFCYVLSALVLDVVSIIWFNNRYFHITRINYIRTVLCANSWVFSCLSAWGAALIALIFQGSVIDELSWATFLGIGAYFLRSRVIAASYAQGILAAILLTVFIVGSDMGHWTLFKIIANIIIMYQAMKYTS